MDSDYLNKFCEDGFFIHKKFVNENYIDKILVDCQNVFQKQFFKNKSLSLNGTKLSFDDSLKIFYENQRSLFFSAAKQIQKIPLLFEIQSKDHIINFLKSINITSPIISYTPLILFNSKFLTKYNTPAHQDWRSMQGSLDSVVIWIALQDIDDGFGNIELIPGSHRLGLLRTKKDDWFRSIADKKIVEDKNFISFKLKKGDALIFSSFLVHKTGVNERNDVRWSLQLRYNNLEEKSFIRRGYPDPYIHKPDGKVLQRGFPTLEELNNFFEKMINMD